MATIKIIALLVCLAAVLTSGCTSSLPAQAPGPVPTATITAQPTTKDLPKVTATITPFIAATKMVNGKSIPYIYERNGRFYAHPVGFVCTEPNPQSQVFIDPNDPGNIVETIWCER